MFSHLIHYRCTLMKMIWAWEALRTARPLGMLVLGWPAVSLEYVMGNKQKGNLTTLSDAYKKR